MKEIIYKELLPAFKSARISYKKESVYAESGLDFPENIDKAIKQLAEKHNLTNYEVKEFW
jgi:hypothetical protein